MNLIRKHCFRHSTGEDIYLFTLRNEGMEVCITNYGAIITSFKIKMQNNYFNDIVLGFERVDDYFSENYLSQYSYFGAACGRYANRIKNGRFSIGGKYYQVSQNKGADHLHGGFEGFDRKIWKVIKFSDSFLELKYISKDGEEGFPGNLETIIRFTIGENNDLTYEFLATTDKETPINLTHHCYFNLANGEGTIENHEIRIPASNILVQDEGLVCTGEFMPVTGTGYDFRSFKQIKKDWNKANGYDQCFVIDNKNEEQSLVAEARLLQSNLTLQIFSTEPAVQFYTGQGLGKITGKKGTIYQPFSGFCLETHKHPNSINIPHFPNTVLRPGEKYFQKNMYKVVHIFSK